MLLAHTDTSKRGGWSLVMILIDSVRFTADVNGLSEGYDQHQGKGVEENIEDS